MSAFASCMNEIREHHKKNILDGKRSRYLPSKEFEHFFVNDNSTSIISEKNETLNGLKIYSQSLGREEANQTESDIVRNTQQLKDNGVSSAAQAKFREEMEKRREAAKEKSNENIDKTFDEGIKIGEDYPELQGEILTLMDSLGAFFTVLWEKVREFVVSVVSAIVEWVKNAWDSIKSAFNSIGNWIAGWF